MHSRALFCTQKLFNAHIISVLCTLPYIELHIVHKSFILHTRASYCTQELYTAHKSFILHTRASCCTQELYIAHKSFLSHPRALYCTHKLYRHCVTQRGFILYATHTTTPYFTHISSMLLKTRSFLTLTTTQNKDLLILHVHKLCITRHHDAQALHSTHTTTLSCTLGLPFV